MRWALPLLVLAAAAAADDIYFKTGGGVLAKKVMIVEETDEKIFYLDKSLKRRSLSKKMVGRVEKKDTAIHEWHRKSDAAQTADDVMALAAWSKKKKFKQPVIQALWERALALDPAHAGANEALGRVLHEGEWMTPAERDRREAEAIAAEMRAKGLVPHEGGWVTPEDKANLEKGLKKHDGKWMTPDQIKLAQGYVKHDGKWVKKDDLAVLELIGPARKDTGLGAQLRLQQTEHYAVMGDLPDAQLKVVADSLERLYQEWVRLFPDAAHQDLLPGKHRVFAFKKNRPYQRFVKERYRRQKKEENWSPKFADLEEQRMRLRLRETSFWEVQPFPLSAHVMMPEPFEAMKAHCVHFAANVLATRYARLRFPTWWLNEGIAYHFEKKVSGSIETFNSNVGGGGYADAMPAGGDQKNPWLDHAKWNALLGEMVRTGRDPALEALKGKVLFGKKNRLTTPELAKAYSIVSFLILDDARKFAAFVKDAKGGKGSDVERETVAVLQHYGSYREIEKRWREFVRGGFRLGR